MPRQVAQSAVVRYGIAVACVAATVILALWLRPIVLAAAQLMLVAILMTGWVSGLRPALVAWVLSTLAFAYWFTPPFDSVNVEPAEIPRLLIFALVAGLLAIVSAARRRAEDSLKRARDGLETRVRERTSDLEQSNERLRGAVAHAVAAHHRFRDLMNSVDGIVWEADAATLQFSFVSDQAERILGYPVGRWLSEPTFWSDHLHPEDREGILALCRKAAAGEERDLAVEYRMIAGDGSMVWLRDRVITVVDDAAPARLRGVMVDITEIKRAERERLARRWFVESMDRVNRAIQSTNDLEQMMSDVLGATLAILDCDRVWLVSPCDPEAPAFAVKMQRARPEFPLPVPVGTEIAMDHETAGVFRTARASRGPVRYGPGAQRPLPAAIAKRWGIQSTLVMALDPKGDRAYLFGVSQCSYPRVWTPQEEALFQEIGRRLTDALTSLSIVRSLRESEKRYRSIFESTGVAIAEEDFSLVKAAIDELRAAGVGDVRAYLAAHPEFVERATRLVRVVDLNNAAVRLFAAASKDELLASIQKIVVPETRDILLAEIVCIAEGRASLEAEGLLQTLRGERLTVLFTVTFPPPSAPFDSVLVTIVDITERRRAEYLTGHVFESSPDAVYIVGRDYRYQRVNAAFERRWRLPAERIVGMRMDELAGTQPFEETYKPNLDRCLAGAEVSFVGWFPTPAGPKYLAATYSPLRPGSPRVEAVLAITRDLTDHVRASEALQQAQSALAHVTRVTTLGEMTASIAHEVNQPLAAIVADANASLNWLASPTPDLQRVREALEAIVKDGHRAADVIQRIRQLATRSSPQKARLDVNDVVREVVPLLGPEVRSHAVSLRLDLAPGLPPVVADRVQLQQVLINFVMNGIEAMASIDDRPRELMIRSQPHDGDHVLVAVRDVGVGIDAGSVDQLFRAFFTTKPGGMGMGLSISRSIIEEHGGRLWATRNATHGATFHFALPALR
jgi:PAS domain S-box-containing protein